MGETFVGIVSIVALLAMAAIPLAFGVRGVVRARRLGRPASNPTFLVLLGVAMVGLSVFAALDRGF